MTTGKSGNLTMEPISEDALKSGHSQLVPCIWLVDDDDLYRKHLMWLLKDEPRVDCSRNFSSSVSLLAAIREGSPPDVILMDVHMPEMNGIEAIRPVKHLAPFTKVLILTSIYDPQLKQTALAAGATDFLLKRYPRAQMIAAICPTKSEFCSPGRA